MSIKISPAETSQARGGSRPASSVRMRAIAVGLLLAVAICAVTPFHNAYKQGTPLGGGHFPLAPFFIFFWMTLLLAFAGKMTRRQPWLSGRELLVVWMLMMVVSGIAYTGLVRTFFVNLTAPYYFASVENRWRDVLQPLLPGVCFPDNPTAIAQLYNGIPGGGRMPWAAVFRQVPWAAWIGPLCFWGGFVLLSYFAMVCLVNLFGRQWILNERMNFPLLRVPILMEEAMAENGIGRFLSNRFFLVGLSIPVALHLINGLHFYHPSVPQMPTLILAGSYFPKYGLFSGFYKLKIYLYPAFIGFAFLTTRQISFSFWVFFFFGGLLFGLLSVLGYTIPAASLGVTFGPTLARPEEMQMIGAYGIFFLFILWLARYHILDILRQAFFLKPGDTGETEWFSIRTSFWGFVISAGMLAGCLHLMGMPPLAAALLVGAFFMILLVASRIICQGGLAYFTLTAAPMDGLIAFFGPKMFTAAGLLVAGAVQKVLFVDLRESLLPSLVHAQKITQRAANRRRVFGGIALALAVGLTVSFLAMLLLCYRYGVRDLELDWATRTTVNVYENVYSLIESPPAASHWVRIFTVVGAVVMLALVVGYHRFYWWPIHPIGYLTAYSSAMRILWFSFFVGWACNALCMRYGGVSLFQRLRYLFVGLIVGDFLMGGIFAVIGLFGDASYLVLPD